MDDSAKHPGDEEFSSHVTHVLWQVCSGDQAAAGDLLPLVYDQLRALAQQRMMQERPGHTLQATDLVHEAFLKLVGPREIPWAGQAHFYAAAAEAMRRILVDHARSRQREKRAGKGTRVLLNVLDLADAENSEEILALDEALCRLEQQEPAVGEVVRLRFFAGLSVDQTQRLFTVATENVPAPLSAPINCWGRSAKGASGSFTWRSKASRFNAGWRSRFSSRAWTRNSLPEVELRVYNRMIATDPK